MLYIYVYIGWEECTDGAVTHLLRTSFAKSAREAQTVATPLSPLSDTEKLKRHIQIVCERLAKGQRLVAKKDNSDRDSQGSGSGRERRSRPRKQRKEPKEPRGERGERESKTSQAQERVVSEDTKESESTQ